MAVDRDAWPRDAATLAAEQARLARERADPWRLPPGRVVAGGCAVVAAPLLAPSAGDEPGAAGAVLVAAGDGTPREIVRACVVGPLTAPFTVGLLALREGPLLAVAVRALPRRPDVLLVHAAGRDHPRRAGLALMLGAVLGVPSVGVTSRPLLARGGEPGEAAGE